MASLDSGAAALDAFLGAAMREQLEERFWRPIEMAAKLDVLRHDAGFLSDPTAHPALFSDHGIVHVRDIAVGLLALGEMLDGGVLPHRPPDRQQFMLTCGVLMAYVHDIGMFDQTSDGRRVHAVYAAHVAFSEAAGDVVDHVLARRGPVADRLAAVARAAAHLPTVDVVLREVLSLTMAHSKSTVPAAVLDDRSALRRLMQRAVFSDLAAHRAAGRTPDPDDASPVSFTHNVERYADASMSFAWLDAATGPEADLADDVLDAVRLLRAADALRQRGTTLRTSGGYEICLDAATGHAVYTLRSGDGDEAFLLRCHDDKAAGEANIRVAMVTPTGHLRIALHRGSFLTTAATRQAAQSCAHVLGDITIDVLPSLESAVRRGSLAPPRQRAGTMRLEVERPSDRPEFADDVIALLLAERPDLAGRVVAVADVESADPLERDRYHRAITIDGRARDSMALLRHMAARGAKVDDIDVHGAFVDVRAATITAGEVLVTLGSPPSFVYVPRSPGLTVVPAGGYDAQALQPWVPVGTTGVVRRAERNAQIVAERDVDVVMIPAARYSASWFRPYAPDELAAALRGAGESSRGRTAPAGREPSAQVTDRC